MRHVSWVVTVPVGVAAIVFAVANRSTTLVNFWPLPWVAELPLFLVVLGCLVLGFVAGGVAAWLSGGRRRRRAREAEERVRLLASEVAELKARAAKQVGPGAAGA